MNDLSSLRMPYKPEAVDEVCHDLRQSWPAGKHRETALRLVATVKASNQRVSAALRVIEEMKRIGHRETQWLWWNPLRPSTWTAWWWSKIVWGDRTLGMTSWRLGPFERRRVRA